MEIYPMRKRKLPPEILGYKNIAKIVLTGKQYKEFLRHHLKIQSYGTLCNKGGHYSLWNREIYINVAPGWVGRTTDTLIHELGHMVFYIKNFHKKKVGGYVWYGKVNPIYSRKKRVAVHGKKFQRIYERLWAKYHRAIMKELPQVPLDY